MINHSLHHFSLTSEETRRKRPCFPGETMYITLVVVILLGIALGVLIPLAVPERGMVGRCAVEIALLGWFCVTMGW